MSFFLIQLEMMQQQSIEKIKVGLSISLSGNYSIQGIESYEGVALWVEEANSRGGIFVEDLGARVPVEFIYYDDESSVSKCKSNIEQLILEDKVDILLGPYSSSLALAACEVAQEYNKTIWNHGGSTDEIEERRFKNVINAITPASRYSYGIIDCIRKADPNVNNIATFSATNSGFSTRIANAAREYGEKLGFEVKEYKFISGTLDFVSELDDLGSYNPDIILGMGRAEDDIALSKQIEKQGIYSKAKAFIVASIKLFKDELGDNSEGYLSASQWERGVQIEPDIGPTPLEFFSNFKFEYYKEPDYVAAQGYNIGLIIEKCIQMTGTLADLTLRQAALQADCKTFYGKFRTDDEGNQIGHEMVVIQWQKGEKVIVHPESAAQAQFIYPKGRSPM